MPTPPPTFVPLIAIGGQRPSGAREGPACRLHFRVRLRRVDSACTARTQTSPELGQRRPQIAPVPRRTHPACRALHQPQSTRGQEEKLVRLTRPPTHPDPQLAPCPRPHPADSAIRHADAIPDLEFRRHSTLVEEAWSPLSNGMQISCRRSCRRPHQSTLPLFGLEEPGARTELWPTPACRLHLRVRRRAARDAGYQESAEVACDHTACHCAPCRS
jgi:hypothetical protein